MVDGRIADGPRTLILASESEIESCTLNSGDLLLNRTNSPDLVGKLAIWDRTEVAVFASYLVRYPARPDRALPRFTIAALSTSRSSQQIDRLITRAISQANINPTAFYDEVEIAVPLVQEQQRVVAVLDAWDRAIEKTERLVNAKRLRYRVLINKQLFGSNARASKGLSLTAKRVTGSNSWPLQKIGDFAREVSVFNRQDKQLPVLSCTKHHGLVLSDEYFAGRRIYSDDVSGYKVVERSQFAYATNHLEEGSIGWQSIVDAGLVSPMYTVFDVDDAAIDRKFLITVLKTETYRQVFEISTSSSVDRRGGLRWEEFAALPFALPSLEIQKQLAAIVETLESDLTSSQAALQSLQKQKRGLMQKLLTGEWQLDERFDAPKADTKGNC